MGDDGDMRKPLVVVCGVAAVLIAGGIAATTAGADTSPDAPGLPALEMPDVPAIPQLDADAAGDQDAPGLALPGLDGPAQDQSAQDQSAQDQSAQDQTAQRPGGHAQPAQGQDAQDQDARDQGAQGQGAQDQGAHGQAAQRPGGQARPAHQRPVAQKPASMLVAAQREVSPSSVSTSPSAPVQQQVLSLVNENRRRGGCGDLSLDRRLIVAAYGHAADMARRGYFAHESPNGEGTGDRVHDAGYRWTRYGENIARGQDSPYEVVDGWMHSAVHRENIMDCRLHQMGIGLAFGVGRTPYWVQDFATPQ